jgi:hypothetical protein
MTISRTIEPTNAIDIDSLCTRIYMSSSIHEAGGTSLHILYCHLEKSLKNINQNKNEQAAIKIRPRIIDHINSLAP